MERSPKVCPECLCEFVATAEMCSDCEVPLVHPEEIDEPDDDDDDLPPIAQLVPVRVASIDWIRGFSEALVDAGISHRVGPPPQGGGSAAARRSHDVGMAVYVRPDDHEQALLVDAEYVREQIPDAEQESDGPVYSDGDGCPACGEAVSDDDAECPSCGLPFVEVE